MEIVTIRELARQLGVSPATVSLALNGNPKISEPTRRRVGNAAARLRYTPNYAAQSLSRGRAHRIDIAVSTAGGLVSGFLSSFLRGAHRRATTVDYRLSLTIVDREEELTGELIPLVASRAVDGIIVLNPGFAGPYQVLDERRLPYVVLGRAAEEATVRVDSDNQKVGADIAYHLQENGYGTVLLLGSSGLTLTHDRLAGLRSVIGKERVHFREAVGAAEAGYLATHAAIDAKLRFDAVVATSDSIAAGALRALSERGIAVPKSVGVVGMDNDLAPFLIPALTSVDFDPEELGFRAVDRLVRLMRGETTPDVEIIGHRLIPRMSTLKGQLVPSRP